MGTDFHPHRQHASALVYDEILVVFLPRSIWDFTADQRNYYGFDESAFPNSSSEGRVLQLLSMP